jgi:ubiquinone/menaquinone biosynthesis C-methylase UbiE
MSAGSLKAIHAAVLEVTPAPSPRILDLGAGSGRIGRPFVDAGDDYVGVDLSLGMLRAFAARAGHGDHVRPRLIQADGRQLPFADAAFDIVMLMQVFGGVYRWRQLLGEARRVLRRGGALVLGRALMPATGLDAQMKQRLAVILAEMEASEERSNTREQAETFLTEAASDKQRLVPAQWHTGRTPRAFLDRHRTGARFSCLPEAVKEESLGRLAAWAAQTFGSLDEAISEQHQFELLVYRF